MRSSITSAMMAGLFSLTVTGLVPAQETPRSIIERAIAAHGGAERLSRIRADKVRLHGKILLPGKDGPVLVPFSGETTIQLPDKFKNVFQMNVNTDKKFDLVQILNGDKAFVTVNGQLQNLPPAALAEMHETMYLDRVVRLVPLLTDRGYELTALGKSKANNREVTGIKVSMKGHKDLRLFFDDETGLLIKSEHVLDNIGGKEVLQEEFYGDFKDFNGYRRPTRIAAFRAGQKVLEAEMLDVKYFNKFDDTEFAKP